MNISDLDSSLEFNLYTNTAQNIKVAKRDIISKRKEIHCKNSENAVLKEIQVIEDEKNHSDEDVVIINENSKAASDDIESADVVVQQNRSIRRSTRIKNNTAVNSSCVSSCSTAGQKSRTSKSRNTNKVIVLDEDYPEPVSSTWVGNGQRKLSEDSIIIIDAEESSLDVANVSDIYEDVNEAVTIVVKWKQVDVHKFQIRKFQNVSSIFEFFAAKECVKADEIVLLRNDKEIQQSDSPDSLGLKCIAMLDGDIKLNRIFYGENNKSAQEKEDIIDLEEDNLILKVQAKHLKQPVEITIKREQKMNILIIKCCEKFNCVQNKLTLKFDGEVISPKDTPDDLGLEGGECFDAYIH